MGAINIVDSFDACHEYAFQSPVTWTAAALQPCLRRLTVKQGRAITKMWQSFIVGK